MTIKTFLKKIWNRRKSQGHQIHVHEKVYDTERVQPHLSEPVQANPVETEVDLSPQKDLENYARGLNVSKKSLEQLISSGMLMPGELEVAEKIVRFMRKNDPGSGYSQ